MNPTDTGKINDILNEIERRYQTTLRAPDDDSYEASLTDVPALVKAVRRAAEMLEWAIPDDRGLLVIRKEELAAILSGTDGKPADDSYSPKETPNLGATSSKLVVPAPSPIPAAKVEEIARRAAVTICGRYDLSKPAIEFASNVILKALASVQGEETEACPNCGGALEKRNPHSGGCDTYDGGKCNCYLSLEKNPASPAPEPTRGKE